MELGLGQMSLTVLIVLFNSCAPALGFYILMESSNRGGKKYWIVLVSGGLLTVGTPILTTALIIKEILPAWC